jgi:sulfite reductase (NADPH) flavoprotein alpha-component
LYFLYTGIILGEEKPSDAHFIHASDSYDMTLHGRLVWEDRDHGVSCNECHAPEGFHHGILPTEHPDSAVNPDRLTQLCGSSGCHGYVTHPLNTEFVLSDMHDLDWVPGYLVNVPLGEIWHTSTWNRVLLVLVPVVVLFMVAGMFWSLFMRFQKDALPILGGKRFERRFLVRKKRPQKKGEKTDQVVKDRWFRLGKKRRWVAQLKRTRKKQHRGDGSPEE